MNVSVMESTVPSRTAKACGITVARGDGIGPEIMEATLRILREAGAELAIEEVEIGESVYKSGHSSGIEPGAWDSLRRNKIFFKAPITTPQGGGYKSLNVTIRKSLGLFANVRPCLSLHPFVETKHPSMDLVVIRENEEDTYAGIEHQQTDEVVQCLKLISRPGCERICRYAFEYAIANGRRKVTCLSKDNIMKLTDGMFHRVFDEIASEYPTLETEHWIVDIGAARLATTPEDFDVVVTPNLYGDILSDVTAQMTGSIGMAGSANIGDGVAMFEAIHGSAPPLAGKNVANPSGLINAGVMMLVHIGQSDVAERVHNAWLATVEDGIHTADVFTATNSRERVGTRQFADAVIERLGRRPEHLKPVSYQASAPARQLPSLTSKRKPARKALVGVDVFVHKADVSPDALGEVLQRTDNKDLRLKMITNRGVKVWPDGLPETFCTDHWRCRFVPSEEGAELANADVISLLQRLSQEGIDFIKTEHLYTFDGERGYSLGQGE
ncbi:MAG: NADP-dependent isocitrate dehydrogenase [Phycisphaerae bacterium]